ncbi:hypothetical protein MaudCBS49596_003859 [Microsporum audouinii]
MAGNPPSSYTTDPTLFLYTSLTAGSSHIITATSRLETILKANKIPFRAIDVATDEKARMIWGRRSKGRKLPGLVRYASIVGDLDQIEEWNEYGELKAQIAATLSPYDASKSEPQTVAVTPMPAPPKTTSSSSAPHIRIGDTPSRTPSSEQQGENMPAALRQASEEAAAKAKETMRARLGLKPQSPIQKPEDKKPEGQKQEEYILKETKSEVLDEKKVGGEKKLEDKKSEDQEPQKKELEKENMGKQEQGKEVQPAQEKPEGKKMEEQPVKGENGETEKLAVVSETTEQSKKAEEQAPIKSPGGTDTAEVESTGDSKPEKAEDEGEASTASPSATEGASSREKEAV